MTRVFIPKDAAALALGADAVARAVAAARPDLEIVRTGSRGLFWLEPLVEVETPAGRRAYGPVTQADVPAILAGGDHPKALGDIGAHPWLARQTRITFARCGVVDPLAPPAFEGLERARAIGPDATIEAMIASGLRGRGGAGFPAGVKWRTVADAIAREAAGRGLAIELVRNGSRGLFWLEPLVEVETPAGRIAYGPVAAADVAGLFDADFLGGGAHPLALGPTEEIDYLKRQERLTDRKSVV